MSSFMAAMIKKGKPSSKNKFNKVKEDELDTADLLKESPVPKAEAVKEQKLKTIDPIKSPVPKAEKPKQEDVMSIDLMLNAAKKKPAKEASGSPIKLSPMGEQMEANQKAFKNQKYLNKIKKYKRG